MLPKAHNNQLILSKTDIHRFTGINIDFKKKLTKPINLSIELLS